MNAMTRVLAVGGFGVLAAVAGFYGSQVVAKLGAQTKHYAVKLVAPGTSGGELKVDVKNQCNSNGHPGCLLFETGKVGQIKFYMQDSKHEFQKCSGTKKTAKKVITKVELTTELAAPTPDKPNDKEEHGDFIADHSNPTFALEDWLKYDAFPAVDLKTGVVFEATYDKAATQVFLDNLNSHTSDDIKHFWYRVTVTGCEEVDGVRPVWVSDPRGDNKGLN
jgi:hypothetical protein